MEHLNVFLKNKYEGGKMLFSYHLLFMMLASQSFSGLSLELRLEALLESTFCLPTQSCSGCAKSPRNMAM